MRVNWYLLTSEFVSRNIWHNLSPTTTWKPQMLVMLDLLVITLETTKNHTSHPLLFLPVQTLSSQLSYPAYGLTIHVNIYFCMMDMNSLMSLLLQRMDWNLPVGRGESSGHLRTADQQRPLNKALNLELTLHSTEQSSPLCSRKETEMRLNPFQRSNLSNIVRIGRVFKKGAAFHQSCLWLLLP